MSEDTSNAAPQPEPVQNMVQAHHPQSAPERGVRTDTMIERISIVADTAFSGTSVYSLEPHIRQKWNAVARAVLRAMREPTYSMVNAPPRPTAQNCNEFHYAVAWQAMIDEALTER